MLFISRRPLLVDLILACISATGMILSGVNKFEVSTFYVIIDQLNNALKQRIKSYSFVQQRFGVLTEFDSMSDEDVELQLKDLLIIIQKISLSHSTQNSVSLFVGTRNSQKNTAEKSQQALLNIFSNCCTQMESTLHS